MKHLQFATLAVFIQCFAALFAYGQDSSRQRSDGRMDYMRLMIQAIKVLPADPNSGLSTRFNGEAILRFGDATRQAADGALWKLGSGRPQVIVAMEFMQSDNQPQLNYEVLLFLESDDNGWRYGLSRMCGAEPTVKFDNNVVWNEPSMDAIKKSWKLGYTGEAHAVEQAPSDAGK